MRNKEWFVFPFVYMYLVFDIWRSNISLQTYQNDTVTILLVHCLTGWAYANVPAYQVWCINIFNEILFLFVQIVLNKILMNSHALIFITTFDFSTLIFTACLHIFLPIASVSMTPEHITCNTIYAHFLKRCSHYFWLT